MIIKEKIQESAHRCVNCSEKDCIARPIGLYIHDKGVNYFLYQAENGNLPEQVQQALILSKMKFILDDVSFLNFLQSLLQ